jgi:hypothetical protein
MKHLCALLCLLPVFCNGQTKFYDIDSSVKFKSNLFATDYVGKFINNTKRLKIYSQPTDYRQLPVFPIYSERVRLSLSTSPFRKTYFDNLNENLSEWNTGINKGTQVNLNYSQYSKRYDYLYRKD